MDGKPNVSELTSMQKMQTEEWLRQADTHIRAGRYLVADEELQKVFSVDPDNEIAFSYQDRIQFFIKQLSQRVGMNVELQSQIRKYNNLVAQRTANQLSSFLVKGQRALEEGYLKRASDYIRRALALDPENVYANALRERLSELQHPDGKDKATNETELKFRSVLQETWHNGIPTEEHQAILAKMQQQLNISDGTRLVLEREIRNIFYKEALLEIWHTGGISAFTPQAIYGLRRKYKISIMDHSAIEATLLREVRKNKIKGTILVVDEDETLLLNIAHELRAHSYAVAAAGTIDEALKTIKTVTPEIVLCEVNFNSGPLGFELFEFIRTSNANRHLPFLFMTTSFDRTTTIIGKRLGVDDFITKPIDYEMLIATITGKILRAYGT